MHRQTIAAGAVLLFASLILAAAGYVAAQYPGSYGYPNRPAPRPRLPNTAQQIGGLNGNPYRNTRPVAATGRPIGAAYSASFGGRSAYNISRSPGGGNPLAYRAPAKPFSNVRPQQPLINLNMVGRAEVMRGIWRY